MEFSFLFVHSTLVADSFHVLLYTETLVSGTVCRDQSHRSLALPADCTAERCFRIDRAQENLHYVMDIAHEHIFVLDQECQTMPQTPDEETASPSSVMRAGAGGSSIESSMESREGTPMSPKLKFFNHSLSGPGSGGTSDSLSPGVDGPSRKGKSLAHRFNINAVFAFG